MLLSHSFAHHFLDIWTWTLFIYSPRRKRCSKTLLTPPKCCSAQHQSYCCFLSLSKACLEELLAMDGVGQNYHCLLYWPRLQIPLSLQAHLLSIFVTRAHPPILPLEICEVPICYLHQVHLLPKTLHYKGSPVVITLVLCRNQVLQQFHTGISPSLLERKKFCQGLNSTLIWFQEIFGLETTWPIQGNIVDRL
jgi:hypothetical protein